MWKKGKGWNQIQLVNGWKKNLDKEKRSRVEWWKSVSLEQQLKVFQKTFFTSFQSFGSKQHSWIVSIRLEKAKYWESEQLSRKKNFANVFSRRSQAVCIRLVPERLIKTKIEWAQEEQIVEVRVLIGKWKTIETTIPNVFSSTKEHSVCYANKQSHQDQHTTVVVKAANRILMNETLSD